MPDERMIVWMRLSAKEGGGIFFAHFRAVIEAAVGLLKQAGNLAERRRLKTVDAVLLATALAIGAPFDSCRFYTMDGGILRLPQSDLYLQDGKGKKIKSASDFAIVNPETESHQ